MDAPAYSNQRREMAVSLGLGRKSVDGKNGGAVDSLPDPEPAPEPAPAPAPAPKARARRARKEAADA